MLGSVSFASINIDNCTTLNESGETYYLTADIVDSDAYTCMNITADNISLDCQGHSFSGVTQAIYISGHNGNTVRNCIVSGGKYGVGLDNANYNTIINCSIDTNLANSIGMRISGSSHNIISGNVIANAKSNGISELSGSFNVFANNSISNISDRGLYLNGVSSLAIGNILTHNYNGFYTAAGNSFINNTIYNSTNAGVLCSICFNLILEGNVLHGNKIGYGLYGSQENSNNILRGGSVSSSSSYDYDLASLSANSFNISYTNFTDARKIHAASGGSGSWFKYNDKNDINLWLITGIPKAVTLTRSLGNYWNQTFMTWIDDVVSATTTNYTISGLKDVTDYYVYNNSVLAYLLETDSNGSLPLFSIYLGSTHEIIVSENPITTTTTTTTSTTTTTTTSTTTTTVPTTTTTISTTTTTLPSGNSMINLGKDVAALICIFGALFFMISLMFAENLTSKQYVSRAVYAIMIMIMALALLAML